MIDFLDRIPLATVLTVAAIIGGLVALVAGDISYEDLLVKLGAFGGGVGILGYARTKAGKGVKG